MIAKTKTKTQKRLTPSAQYVRMSSGKQERSPAQQRAEIKKLAAREGCKITRRFVDEGITGDSGPEQRPDFKAMLEAAEQGEFEVLLLENIDRLGRFDSLAGAEYYNRLRRAGVKIITCADGPIDLDSFEGRLVQTVKQEGKHAFLKDLSRKVLRGQVANAKAGNCNGGPAPYGFDRAQFDPSDKLVKRLRPGQRKDTASHHIRLVPSQDKARIAAVKYMFTRFDQAAVGLRTLARELGERGYPDPSGRGWSHHNVARILKSTIYCGTNRWGWASHAKYHTTQGDNIVPVSRKSNGKWKPAEDAVLVEGSHTGIISPELFQRVQKKLGRQARKRCKNRAEFPLSGLIFCGHCGQPMHGTSISRHDRQSRKKYRYEYYICSRYAKFGRDGKNNQCGHQKVDAAAVLTWLTTALQQVFLGPARAELVTEIKRQLRAGQGNGRSDSKRLRARLGELDREVGRLVKAIRTIDAPELVQELEAARAERAAAKTALERVARLTDAPDLDQEAEAVADQVWDMGKALRDADPAETRELLRRAVSRITCHWQQQPTRRGGTICRLVGGEVELRQSRLFSCLSGSGTGVRSLATVPDKLLFSAGDLKRVS